MNDSMGVVENYNQIIKKIDNLYSWGTYQINDNKIKATINSLYFGRGHRWKHIATNYEGIISAKNCITNWKTVPPYPDFYKKELHKGLNHNFEYELNEKSFVYKFFPAVSILNNK